MKLFYQPARSFSGILAALVTFVLVEQVTYADDPPNVVLILADDFGWGDTSCNNPDSAFQTPHLDRLAMEGIRCTNAYTPHSVCTPTRYALLTGRYAWRSWVREGVLAGYGRAMIPPTRETVASLLKKKGYASGVFGKWHVGIDWTVMSYCV